jgi:hypothetical protein
LDVGWVEFFHGDKVISDKQIKFIFYIREDLNIENIVEKYHFAVAEIFKDDEIGDYKAYFLLLNFATIESVSYNAYVFNSIYKRPSMKLIKPNLSKPNFFTIKYKINNETFELGIFIPLIGEHKISFESFVVKKINKELFKNKGKRVKNISDINMLLKLNYIITNKELYDLTKVGDDKQVEQAIYTIRTILTYIHQKNPIATIEPLIDSLDSYTNSDFISQSQSENLFNAKTQPKQYIKEDSSNSEDNSNEEASEGYININDKDFVHIIENNEPKKQKKPTTYEDYQNMYKSVLSEGNGNTREGVLFSFLELCKSNIEMFKANYELNYDDLKNQIMTECHDNDTLGLMKSQLKGDDFFKNVFEYLKTILQNRKTLTGFRN